MRIAETWPEKGYAPPDQPVDELITVPKNAQYYAAYGAAIFGIEHSAGAGVYRGLGPLRDFIAHGRTAQLGQKAGPALVRKGEDLDAFARAYRVPEFSPPDFTRGAPTRGFVGFDGGSTSSKAVLIDEHGAVLAKEYLLSRGNPLQDAKEILARIRDHAAQRGCPLRVIGCGVTGYAADVLDRALHCDANVVETVAHMISATHSFGADVDVICDVGGQDIKVLFLQNGQIKNFRLSNQCSAGNGMLLQAMASQFGVDIRDFADIAFRAELSPRFSYG